MDHRLSVEVKKCAGLGFSLYRVLLFSFLCCIHMSLNAQTRIEIPGDIGWSRHLIDELEVMGDEQEKWTAESLFATSNELFEPNTADKKPVLHNYWARFELANVANEEQWVSFESFYWDYVILYFRDSTGNIATIPFGILSNPNNNKFLVHPKAQYTVLANFKSSGQFRREDNINLVIKPTLPTLENKAFTHYIDGITFGIMFGLALYNLFLFISLRDRTYFWYSIYILFFALSFATLFANTPSTWAQFFFPDFPFFAFYLKKIADPIIWIAYANFVRNFLATKERHPRWDKALKISIALIILQFLINLTGIYHFTGIQRTSLTWLTPVFIGVTLAIISYIKGYVRAKFFILGQLFLFVGLTITFIFYAGMDIIYFLPETAFFNYFRSPSSTFVFGAIEAIVFSFALADKYNQLQKDITAVKIEKEKEKSEALRLQELDTFKTRFYSNITHEFRTPLTVIDGLASELENNPTKASKKDLSLIRKNSKQLLALVNQMLDLSKMQTGKVTVDLQQDDLIVFIKYLVEANSSFANLQKVGLQFYSEEQELWTDFDAKKLEQILNNLISNAVKFTPEYGKVLVVAKKTSWNNDPMFELLVKDNGVGISSEQLPYIFDRFYQANPLHARQGSGIGLALVKELVTILEGTINVESELGKGTEVRLRFPIRNNAPLLAKTNNYTFEPLVYQEIPTNSEYTNVNNDLPILLIIEDNIDVTYYLTTCLQDDYQIISSRNGKEGVEKALEVLPDIIITDVMMPEMDGFEVCKIVKEDERSSHIPIIMLTAKATSEDRLIGLTQGADAYLVKPFEKAELIIRLNNLLETRRKLQKKYSNMLISKQPVETIKNKEDSFIGKVEKTILSHLQDEDFSIHVLAHHMHLSRSQLYRKIKALTGMSTAIYIRHIRLHQAKELLDSTELSISEIAYEVGFKSPVYFSQSFKEVFGQSPDATRK